MKKKTSKTTPAQPADTVTTDTATTIAPTPMIVEMKYAQRPPAPRQKELLNYTVTGGDPAPAVEPSARNQREAKKVEEHVAKRAPRTTKAQIDALEATVSSDVPPIHANGAAVAQHPMGNAAGRLRAGETVTLAVDAPSSEEPEGAPERMAELSAAVAHAKPAVPAPSGAAHDALIKAKFQFIHTAAPDRADGDHIHGYQHEDGRVAAYSFTLDDHRPAKLVLRYDDGRQVEDAEAMRHLAMNAKDRIAEKKRARRQQHVLDTQRAKSARAVAEGRGVMDEIERRIAEPAPTPEAVAGCPGNVVRAIEMLGGLTLQRFDLQLLRGDRYYGKRMALLKRLFARDRVLAKECGINNLVEAFYSAVGAEGRSAAAKANDFAARCKDITAKVRRVKAAATRAEKRQIAAVKRATVLERTVPGKIVPFDKPLSKKEQAAKDAAEQRALRFQLAASTEQYPIPKADAEVAMNLDDVRLLEDPDNGIVLMQVEKNNSQGAICVYNNGVRVACGVVPTETLRTLRQVAQDVSQMGVAASQLLNPIDVTIPVTPVAARHLTAVIESCKERQSMEAAATKTKKFAAPAKTTAKDLGKPVVRASKETKLPKKTAAAKAEKNGTAPRGHNYVLADEKALGEHRSPQLAFIVEQLKKAGKAGMTKADIVAAAIKAGDKKFPTNQPHDRAIGFYLSKFKGAGALKFA